MPTEKPTEIAKSYMISKVKPEGDVYTLHLPIKHEVRGDDFIIKQQEQAFYKQGRFYNGDVSLRDRIMFGLSMGESYVVDERLPEEQQKHIGLLIAEIEKELQEAGKWP